MKRLWPLLLLFIALSPTYSQEVKHAPTVEQCRADQKLWIAKLEEPDGADVRVTYKELSAWFDEMFDCQTVDPDRYAKYYNTLSEIGFERLVRLQGFVLRHSLQTQFLAEDAQGKR